MSKIKVVEFKGAYRTFTGNPSKECEEYIYKHKIKKEDIIKICYSSENRYSSILLVYEEE